MKIQKHLHLRTSADGVFCRRSFLQSTAAAGVALGFKDAVALQAAELRKEGMACILLFMNGGPSQFETFDPKPGKETGGPTPAIDTTVSGIQIAEPWVKVAQQMKDIALIRTVTNKEGAHPRAVYQLHTGYIPSAAINYPTFGSIAAKELGDAEFDLPSFVAITNRRNNPGSGILGMQFAPFVVNDANKMPMNVELPGEISTARFDRRLNFLKEIDAEFGNAGASRPATDHLAIYESAARMVKSPRMKAFDLNRESSDMRERYGRTPFGQACLLARRLVETGVTFIEIESDGWDTHQQNFDRVKALAGPVDQGFAALVSDLKARGMLDRTLVIWMGEFGRTPRINANTGRDHFPLASNVALAGAGIRGGQVIGATSDDGTSIKNRPVSVPDLFCSFCQALKINPRKENHGPLDRPIKIVDGGNPVSELFA